MQFMIQDLEACDSIRTEIIKLRADIKHQSNMIDQKDKAISSIRTELLRVQNYNDSLSFENTSLQVTSNKQYSSLRKSRNWWVATAIAGVLSGFVVHMHWKYGKGIDN